MRPFVFEQVEFEDYALLDSGAGEKLERYGEVVVRRPDPQALWARRAQEQAWRGAHLSFERDPASGGKRGSWIVSRAAPECARGERAQWSVRWRDAVCIVRPTPFKHLGLFPEQATNWAWTSELAPRLRESQGARPRMLNLFGYTGVASVVAAQAGYEVTHVDASKTSLAWLRDNMRASQLADDAVRIVLDDALAFTRREVRRGQHYAGIMVDPPHFGRGPKGETWQFEEHVAPLLDACRALLAPRAWLVLSTYAIGYSPLAFENMLGEFESASVESGELALPEREPAGAHRRLLPCGFCARLTRGLA